MSRQHIPRLTNDMVAQVDNVDQLTALLRSFAEIVNASADAVPEAAGGPGQRRRQPVDQVLDGRLED